MLQSLIVMGFVSLGVLLQPSETGSAPYVPTAEDIEQDAIYSCAYRLLAAAGRTGVNVRTLPALYYKASRDKGQEFLEYSLAVMYVESRFNRNALSPKDARGLMQMTEIAVLESTRRCNLPAVNDQQRMHDSYTNVRYGTCYLGLMLEVAEGNWNEALILYNGGHRQLTRYRKGERLTQETADYVVRVNQARAVCRGESAPEGNVK